MKLFLTLVIAVGAIAMPRSVLAQHLDNETERTLALNPRSTAASAPRESERTPVGTALLGGLGAAGGSALLTYGMLRGMTARCDVDDGSLHGALNDALECALPAANMMFLMGSLAFPATIAGGVTLGGHLGGGHGRYDMTLIGSTLGTGAGWAFLAAMAAVDTDAAFAVGMVGFPLMQVAGALAAYHLSHRARTRGRERQFGPTLAPMRSGAVVGLAGRF